MDGRQRSFAMKRVEPGRRCKVKVRSDESITREFVENELSDSNTSTISPESLSSSLEDTKPMGLKPPSPVSRRRLFKEASPSSIRAFHPMSQDLNANSSREQGCCVPLHPSPAKLRIVRNVPPRPRSGLFRSRLPNLSLYRIDNGGPSIMEKVVRVERELEMEGHIGEDGLSNMDVQREVAIREFYDKLPPYKQYIFKDRMLRMGELLPNAVLRARPNVGLSDLLRTTSPLFIPTSLLENQRAGIALAEIQEEEREIVTKERTGLEFVHVTLFPDDLDFDKAYTGCSRVRIRRYNRRRLNEKYRVPVRSSLGRLATYNKPPKVLLAADQRPLFGMKIGKIRSYKHEKPNVEEIDVEGEVSDDLLKGPVLTKPLKLPAREKPSQLSTSPLFEDAMNSVSTELVKVKSRLKGFCAFRIKKTTFTNATYQTSGSLPNQMGSAQDRGSDTFQEPILKKRKLRKLEKIDLPAGSAGSHSTQFPHCDMETCGSSPVKMLKEEAPDEYEQSVRDDDAQSAQSHPSGISSVIVKQETVVYSEPTSEIADGGGGKSEDLAMERLSGSQPETGPSTTIDNANFFLTSKGDQVSEKEFQVRVLRRDTTVVDDKRTELIPPDTKTVPIINMDKLLEVDDVHKPCEFCNRLLSPTVLRVHKIEHAEFGVCGITEQTYKCPYKMCTGERELDSIDEFCLHLLFQHYQPAGIYEKVFYTHLEFFEWIYRFQERGDYHCVTNHPGQRDARVRVKQFRCIYTKPSRCATMPDFPDSNIMYEMPKTTCRYIPRGYICPSFYTQYAYPDGTVKIRYCSCHLHDTVSPAVPSIVRQRARELHVMGVDERMMHYNLLPENNTYTSLNSWVAGVIRGLADEAIMSMLDFLKENPRQRSDFLTKDNFDKLMFPVLNFGIDYGNEREQENGPRPAPTVTVRQKKRSGVRRKYSIFHPTGEPPFPGNPLLEDEIDKINKLGTLYLLNKDLEGFRYYVEVVDKLADYLDFDEDEPPHFLVNKRKPPCSVPKFPVDPKRQKRARGRPRKYPLPFVPSEYVTSWPNSDDMNIFDQSRDSRSMSYGLAGDSTALFPASGTLADVLGVYAERVLKSEARSSNSDCESSTRDWMEQDLPRTSTQIPCPPPETDLMQPLAEYMEEVKVFKEEDP